jgi:hypothetical protein
MSSTNLTDKLAMILLDVLDKCRPSSLAEKLYAFIVRTIQSKHNPDFVLNLWRLKVDG